ncbi:hypothetical protein FHS36_002690 [Streptomyces eurocidicus]|nr:hypothetical protein [Streptomyces eurocidicus]
MTEHKQETPRTDTRAEFDQRGLGLGRPSIRRLTPVSVPLSSSPPTYPTREDCGICDRYRGAINAALGRAQWAAVQGDRAAHRKALREEVEYHESWGGHLDLMPHRDVP